MKLGEEIQELSTYHVVRLVNSKVNQPWIFIGRTDAEVESPILWPPDAKQLTHWKISWCWERLRTGVEGGNGAGDGWMALSTQRTWQWTHGKLWKIAKDREAWTAVVLGLQRQLSNWTATKDIHCQTSFHILCHLFIFFGEVSFQFFGPFLLGCLFSCCWVFRVLYIFGCKFFIRYVFYKYFLWLVFPFS